MFRFLTDANKNCSLIQHPPPPSPPPPPPNLPIPFYICRHHLHDKCSYAFPPSILYTASNQNRMVGGAGTSLVPHPHAPPGDKRF